MKVSKNISTKDYMVDGWDRCSLNVHPYRRGSRHNVIGMWVMWSYYVLITLMIVRLIVVLNV